ncbi:MAG TPA: hypothetical protein VIX83_10855 [Candidatus Cybelea sp.]
MFTSHTRSLAAAIVGSLSLAACAGSGSPTPVTPLGQPAQKAPEAANGGRCKVLPIADRPAVQRAQAGERSSRDASFANCGIRLSHEGARRPNTSSLQAFDVPGAIDESNCSPYEVFNDCGTFGITINGSGTIAGYYLDTNDAIEAFIRTPDATYTSFQAENKWATYAFDLANGGAIAGQYYNGKGVVGGFIRQKNGSVSRYQAPWASRIPDDSVGQGTSPGAINAGGETGGIYFDAQGVTHGYIRNRDGSFVKAAPDGAVTSSVCIACLNNHGASAGDYKGSDGVGRGFIRSAAGAVTSVTERGATDTGVTGINNRDVVLGFYIDTNSVVWGLILGKNHKRTSFQDPNASETYGNGTQPEAINDAGAVTGFYADAQGNVHGFYRSPSGQFSEFDPQGSIFTEPYAINDSGTVTGYWYDAAGATHGFVWAPN